MLYNLSINNAVSYLYDVLYEAIYLFTAIKRFKTSTFSSYFHPELKRLIIEKKKTHKPFKLYGRREDYLHFSHLREQCKELSHRCYQSYLNKVQDNIDNNPCDFWKFVNDRKKSYNLPCNMLYNNVESSNVTDTGNLFADFFSNIYSTDKPSVTPPYIYERTVDINHFYIDLKDIIEQINIIPPKLSFGLEGVPPNCFIQCVYRLAIPIHIIFNLSLNSGIFPEYLKHSFLKPMYKSGTKHNVENYTYNPNYLNY